MISDQEAEVLARIYSYLIDRFGSEEDDTPDQGKKTARQIGTAGELLSSETESRRLSRTHTIAQQVKDVRGG